jgi:hypothetical protein
MLKFTIRDLFLFVLAVGLGAGWLVDHWRQADALASANQRAAKATADAKELAFFASAYSGLETVHVNRLRQKYGYTAEPAESDDFTSEEQQRMRNMLDARFRPIGSPELHAKISRMLDRDKARQEAWGRQYRPVAD